MIIEIYRERQEKRDGTECHKKTQVRTDNSKQTELEN